jgi:hypothetical protein
VPADECIKILIVSIELSDPGRSFPQFKKKYPGEQQAFALQIDREKNENEELKH